MISFAQLKAELKELHFHTLRMDTETYFEAVISKEDLSALTLKLEKAFGAEVWPGKGKLPEYVDKTIKEFGGIAEGQTLYFSSQENSLLFAMLWPWQDGKNITLRLAVK